MEIITQIEGQILTLIGLGLSFLIRAIIRDFKNNKFKLIEKKETDSSRKLILQKIEKIEHSQKYQSEQITLLLDLNKNFKDRQLLEQKIIDIVSLTSQDINNELLIAVANGGDEAVKIFNWILLNDFNVEIQTVKSKIDIALKKIKRVCNCSNLDISKSENFKIELKQEIEKLIGNYLKEMQSTFQKVNGIRRTDFIDKSTTLVLQIISEVEILYKKHK